MSLPLSDKLRSLLQDRTKSPQLILEIDGLPAISSLIPKKYAEYGDDIFYGDSGLVYGGLVPDGTALPYIDLSRSTNQITQQMLVDKGGFSSVTSFDVSIVDKDQAITKIISPSFVINEIISKKCRLYLSLEGAGHPKDSVEFFSGIVAGVSAGAGYVNINLASPEKLKNLEIFPKLSTELSSLINNSVTTIPVLSTESFSVPADSGTLRTYIIIEDEYIEYTGLTSTSFTGCVRGQFGSIANSHALNTNVQSAYRLTGNLRDLSLKLMLSGLNIPYIEDYSIISFNTYGPTFVQNAIFVTEFNFDQKYGVVAGDLITISGATNLSNNITTTVNSVVTNDLGSYIILGSDLITEGSGATFSIKSKYSVLPKFCGLEMTPDQVDVAEFEKIYTQFSANFFDYDFFIKDQVNGNDFINTQILYPSGCYALPRKAKTSLGTTIPPLGQSDTKKLNSENVIGASTLKIERNISKNFYNAVVIKYAKDQVDDKFKRGKIRQSSDSTNRIKVANKSLNIDADGVVPESSFAFKFDIIGRRFLDRYQFAAEYLDIQVDYGTGFNIEIGDVVILDGSSLQISDSKVGSRSFLPRLFEVQNKVLNLKGAPVKLSIVDTAFNINGRYGTISPSSVVLAGSTTTQIKLKKSFGTNLGFNSENYKWRNLVGSTLRIRSDDYSYDNESVIISLDPANDDGIILDPPLPSAPIDGYIIDVAKYPDSIDASLNAFVKLLHVSWNNQITVVTGISQTQFTVSAPDALDIKVGYQVKIHDDHYTYQSITAKVANVTGVTITVDVALGITPQPLDRIELLGWPDSGPSYLWL